MKMTLSTHSKEAIKTGLAMVIVYGIALWILLPIYGNTGLWAALLISFVVRGITLGLRYPSLEADADKPMEAA